MTLIDSNILVYAHNADSPHYERAKRLIKDGLDEKISICCSVQNLIEFYSIITNPKRVQKPLGPPEACEVVELYFQTPEIKVLEPSINTYLRVIHLARQYKIAKAQIFDALLAATMEENDVIEIFTADVEHFQTFPFVTAINPLE